MSLLHIDMTKEGEILPPVSQGLTLAGSAACRLTDTLL